MGGVYSEGGAYWKEGAKSNHYGICMSLYVSFMLQVTCNMKSKSTIGTLRFCAA